MPDAPTPAPLDVNRRTPQAYEYIHALGQEIAELKEALAAVTAERDKAILDLAASGPSMTQILRERDQARAEVALANDDAESYWSVLSHIGQCPQERGLALCADCYGLLTNVLERGGAALAAPRAGATSDVP